jgi:uncharacterized protein (UPF0335 family)
MSDTTAGVGHNSESAARAAKAELLSIIERIEVQEAEIRERQEDRKEIYQEAKSRGYDVAALKAIVRQRAETEDDRRKREEREAVADTYRASLGILG